MRQLSRLSQHSQNWLEQELLCALLLDQSGQVERNRPDTYLFIIKLI